MMKRSRDVVDEQAMTESLATVANYLMLLSRTSPITSTTTTSSEITTPTTTTRVFECKTCNRQFPSFQALGGHRASHKKPRLSEVGAHSSDTSSNSNTSPAKPKTHECSICGLEFAIGQALGGHMRRHRAVYATDGGGLTPSTALSLSLSCPATAAKKPAPSTNKAGGHQALCLDLDLNLTPMENGLEVGKLAAIFG